MGVDETIQHCKEEIKDQDTPPIGRNRFWEIDFLRGCAIILMMGFHWTVDRYFINGDSVWVSPLVLSLWQMVTAGLFLLLAGVSLTLRRDPSEKPDRTVCHFQQHGNLFRHRHLWRGLVILGWGLLITAITRLFLPKEYVIFGILHLIGIAVLISQPLLHLKTWNLALGIMVIGLGIYLNHQRVPFPWLLWAGFIPDDFASIDYFPLFPWYGAVLIGIFLGNTLYGNQRRNFPLKDPNRCAAIQWLCFLGRNSLMIYLIHQPILLLFVLVVSK
jgi:uncharacterized membrane protein